MFLKILYKLGLKLYDTTWNGYSIVCQISSLTAWHLGILICFLLQKCDSEHLFIHICICIYPHFGSLWIEVVDLFFFVPTSYN